MKRKTCEGKNTMNTIPHIACYKCGKAIRWNVKAILREAVSPGDFRKAYHQRCYQIAEQEAKRELGKLGMRLIQYDGYDDR